MKRLITILGLVSLPIAIMSASAAPMQQTTKQPIYTITINVVDRSTKAINYQHRDGSTTVDFKGTPLMAAARGEAKVESKQGYMEVEVEFDNLQPATRFGPELLTYVLWAITPEGRATNMGEIILNGTKSKLDVTTELQSFGMIVTAEPYYAVSQPSDVVVMENAIRVDTRGKVEEIEAKYQLLQRGQYTVNVLPADLKAIVLDKNTPLDLFEARNAVRIARWAGADKSAAESYQKASKLLDQAEAYKTRKADDKTIAMAAREAVQTAEDARLITLKTQAEARLAAERAASAAREANANTKAADARAAANDAERAAAAARAQTERARLEAQATTQRATETANALAERTKLDADRAALRAEREKMDAAAASQQALVAASDRAAKEKADAAAASQQALMAASDRAATEKADAAAASQLALKVAGEQSDREKRELRSKLITQLNLFLDTRDSARGLIVNMSDVLFDSGQYALKPGAREKLAKISGIILAYPTLKLAVEGYTDSVGTDDLNMKLSENRAGSVRDFMVQQGIAGSSIQSHGFGESQPVATNDTASGRQQNRRVELIVSGEVIGVASR